MQYIDWDGYSGLRVEQLHAKLQHGLINARLPRIIMLHVGGNNIVYTNRHKIVRTLKQEISYITEHFNNSLIVWIFILPRLTWTPRNSSHSFDNTMNTKRLAINRALAKHTLSLPNGRVLNIKSIDRQTPGFFRQDKVHLSSVGNELYIHAIMEAAEQFLSLNPNKYIEI